MRRYETIFIALADLSPEDIDSMIDRYRSMIESLKGIVVKVDKWGKRRLAYPIRKRFEGIYVLIDLVAEHAALVEVERNFKFDENILRYQSVNLSDKVDMAEIEREIAAAQKEEAVPEELPADMTNEEAAEITASASEGEETIDTEEPLEEPEEEKEVDEEKGGEK